MPNVSARGRAFAQLVGIVLLIVAATASSPRKVDPTPYLAANDHISDLQLYQAIAHRVADGEGYYPVAMELQRANGWPTTPFVTVRLPTLAWAEAFMGGGVLLALQVVLLLAGATAWFAILNRHSRLERYVAAGLYAVFGGSMISLGETAQHEVWAGLLISLALPLSRRFPVTAIVLGLLASLIRELAVPFLGLIAVIAWAERERGTSIKAVGALAAICLALAAHYFAVRAFTVPGEPASQGWLGIAGPSAVVMDMSVLTAAGTLSPIVYAVAGFGPMLGWLSLPGRTGRLAALWFGGVLFAVMVLGRPDNLRWMDMLMPGYFVGLALVPRVLAGLIGKAPMEPVASV